MFFIFSPFSESLVALEHFIQANTRSDNSCGICGKFYCRPQAVKFHIESAHGKHFNVVYPCELCGKVLNTKNLYWTHKSRCKLVNAAADAGSITKVVYE